MNRRQDLIQQQIRRFSSKSSIDYSLYLVTDSRDKVLQGKTIEETVKKAIKGGVSVVQLREKDPVPNSREFLRRAHQLSTICKQEKVPFIVNDRVDIALAVDADGVHVGQEDMRPSDARMLIGPDKILGVTVGNEVEAREALVDGRADYLGTNAIFSTSTKSDAGNPVGLENLKTLVDYAHTIAGKPVVGIGGINQSNAKLVMDQSPAGLAVVSAIISSDNPFQSAQQLRRIVDVHRFGNEYSDFREQMVQSLDLVRQQRPLIHNITNFVVMNTTANAILAVGGSPIMAHAHEEMYEMSNICSALVINPGTLDPYWIDSMRLAGEYASSLKKPIVLDPVGCGASRLRTDTYKEFLKTMNVTILKGNEGEIATLCGDMEGAVRGVDSHVSLKDPASVAKHVARTYNCVVVMTGAIDYITDGQRVVQVTHNVPLLSKITGSGCILTSLTACFASVTDPFHAACAASAFMGVCAELAARSPISNTFGPATFQEKLFDNFANLSLNEFRNIVKFHM